MPAQIQWKQANSAAVTNSIYSATGSTPLCILERQLRRSPTHTTVWLHSNWCSNANDHSAQNWCRENCQWQACYTVKSQLNKAHRTAILQLESQNSNPPRSPVIMTHYSRARTVPEMSVKTRPWRQAHSILRGSAMAWTRAMPILERKLQQIPNSEFAQISRAKRLKFSQNSADDTLFTQPGSQNAILERNAQIIINFLLDLSKRWLHKLWKQANFAAVTNLNKSYSPHPCALVIQLPITYPHHSVGSL